MPPKTFEISLASAFIAIGAVARIILGSLADVSPPVVFGILIKVGLTETLAITYGLVYGPVQGLLAGFMIIVVSDLLTVPGPWTPFIAAIIGLLGFLSGLSRKYMGNPSGFILGLIAVPLTLLSEFLQNSWVAVFYNVPIFATMITGLPSLITALVNNVVLLTCLGPRLIRALNWAGGDSKT